MFFQEYGEILLRATGETLYMTALSVLFSYLLGLPLGVLTFAVGKGSLHPSPVLSSVLNWIINITRSIPFIILIVALVPLTRLIAGKAIGPTAAVVPLVIGAVPFVARVVESSIQGVDRDVISCARSMGANNLQIVCKVILPEILPSLVLGMPITIITLIAYTTMAGAVGAGGLGDIAIRYGYHRSEYTVMYVTVILLVLMVQIVQFCFSHLVKKIDKNN